MSEPLRWGLALLAMGLTSVAGAWLDIGLALVLGALVGHMLPISH